MRTWRHLLGGLLLWATHFFVCYGIASILPGTRWATVLILIATGAALITATLLFVISLKEFRRHSDKLRRWIRSAAALGYALAGVAITYQGLAVVLL